MTNSSISSGNSTVVTHFSFDSYDIIRTERTFFNKKRKVVSFHAQEKNGAIIYGSEVVAIFVYDGFLRKPEWKINYQCICAENHSDKIPKVHCISEAMKYIEQF
jgi:hypothetical protein